MATTTTTRFYDTDVQLVADGRYEVGWPAFPGVVVALDAPDRTDALARSMPWLAGCVIEGWEDD